MKKIFICIALLLLGDSGAYAVDFQKAQIHGFISQGYLISEGSDNSAMDDGTFEFNEFGINGMVQITDDLRAGIQIQSRNLIDSGNNEVKIDWAYADYSCRNWLGIQAGKMKMRYGLYNQSRDIDAARTSIFLPGSVYNEYIREATTGIVGVGIYGLLPGNLTYEIQAGAITGMDTLVDGMDSDSDNIAIGLEWETPLEGLKLAASCTTIGGKTDSDNIVFDSVSTIFSVEYIRNNFKSAFEYGLIDIDSENLNSLFIGDQTTEGYYVSAGYRFTDWLEVGSYYSVFYGDKDDRDGDRFEAMGLQNALGWLKDLAVFARFDINEYWLLKIEGHAMDGLLSMDFFNESLILDPDPEEHWYMFAVKTTISF